MEFEGEDKNELGRIITDWHTSRLKDLIDSSGGKIITGGKVNVEKKYCAPTIILNPKDDSTLMQEEIFGPILPVSLFTNIDDVITIINKKDKALAVYYFGPKGSKNS